MTATAQNRGGPHSGEPQEPPRYLYGVVGSPVGHSISPALHTFGYARSGHPGAYLAFDKTPAELPDFMRAVRALPLNGLSVTIPHKEAVISFLDGMTDRARAVGAVNTLFWRGTELIGDNTDVYGFMAPLVDPACAGSAALPVLPPKALVLGAGGACRAVLAALTELGIKEVRLCARDPQKTAALAGQFACLPVNWDDRGKMFANIGPCLLVNTTPLGMRGPQASQSPLSADDFAGLELSSGCIVYDIIYTPRETPLLAMARRHGMTVIDGLPFLVAQGLEQFRIWTGQQLDFAEALARMEQELGKR